MDRIKTYLQQEANKYTSTSLLNGVSFVARNSAVISLTEFSLRHSEKGISAQNLPLISLIYALFCATRIVTSSNSLRQHGFSSAIHEKILCDLYRSLKTNFDQLQQLSEEKFAALGGMGIGILMSTAIGSSQLAAHNFGKYSLRVQDFAPHYLLALSGELLVISALNYLPSAATNVREKRTKKKGLNS